MDLTMDSMMDRFPFAVSDPDVSNTVTSPCRLRFLPAGAGEFSCSGRSRLEWELSVHQRSPNAKAFAIVVLGAWKTADSSQPESDPAKPDPGNHCGMRFLEPFPSPQTKSEYIQFGRGCASGQSPGAVSKSACMPLAWRSLQSFAGVG